MIKYRIVKVDHNIPHLMKPMFKVEQHTIHGWQQAEAYNSFEKCEDYILEQAILFITETVIKEYEV